MTTGGTDVSGTSGPVGDAALAVTGAAGAPQGGAGDAAPADVRSLTFDEALAELQRTVAALEEGGLPLEKTLELYERGAALHARCTTLLDQAELRIRRLVDGPDGVPTLADEPVEGAPAAAEGAAGEEAQG